MHTTEGERFRFFHNGDFSGDVQCVDLKTKAEIRIPFDDLKTVVAAGVRTIRTERLESASDDEVLGLT